MGATATLGCPQCGAPITRDAAARVRGGLWPCLFCGALLRIDDAAGDAAPTIEHKLSDEQLARVRQLVVDGKRAEAYEVCAAAGVPKDLVDELATQVLTSVMFSQRLKLVGVAMLAGMLAVAGFGGYLIATSHPIGWLPLIVGLLLALPLVRAIGTTLRMLRLPRAVATIKRATLIGARNGVELYAFEVDVAPDAGAAFASTMLVPSRAASRHKAVPGARLYVRFAPDDHAWLRFDGIVV